MQYVLVHGSWQGGWCWQQLATLLQQKGHQVSSVDLPGHNKNSFPLSEVTYDLYYQYLVKEIMRYSEPCVLVAHSMSGILAAPLLEEYPDKISHLFLIAAFVAQNGQSLLDIALSGGPSEIPHMLIDDLDNKAQRLDLEKVKTGLYHDCPSEIAEWAINQLQPQPIAPLITPIHWTDSGKTSHKRTYFLCEDDRDVHPTTQRNILKNYPCQVVHLQSGHFPFLSQPENLLNALENRLNAVELC